MWFGVIGVFKLLSFEFYTVKKTVKDLVPISAQEPKTALLETLARAESLHLLYQVCVDWKSGLLTFTGKSL